ncbi:hypothetical protein K8Z61_17190 [Nocardioides sp. TRM66260-LWL]|uniref:hypothetical protein n=1 Tax=Nocardioides sp. TRM66260-LWL TaxID=2874478 RepID=UPI001CC58A2B|nr:hypothetical protein [Nocardioides sp. TRM66260-LWL]MBZ5736231.1 hypothetical protein [Nocardioides sp. TRM66260-LWL]
MRWADEAQRQASLRRAVRLALVVAMLVFLAVATWPTLTRAGTPGGAITPVSSDH